MLNAYHANLSFSVSSATEGEEKKTFMMARCLDKKAPVERAGAIPSQTTVKLEKDTWADHEL